jgi:hypothetical protein
MTCIGDRRTQFHFSRPGRNTYRTASLLWAAALLIGSLQPSRPANIHYSPGHNIVHFLGFGALAFLATVGFGNPVRSSFWPATACFFFGFAIEFLQHWQNRMPIEWHDVRDNAIGILAAIALLHAVYRRTDGPKKVVIE